MFIDIESLLNRYKNFFGSLPDGIHYSPTADTSSGSASSGASSSKASSSKASSSSAPATGQKMSDSRWDGDPPSGKDKNGMYYINGFSILFKGGKAYFGGSLDTGRGDFSALQEKHQGGVDCTVDGGTITFFDTKTGKSVVCAYSGTTITDTNGYLSSGYTGYVYRRSR